MTDRELSFPCLICGKSLTRVFALASPAQPNDGVMCSTGGNYGSTVYDPMNGEQLHFNICDGCLVEAGVQGRLMRAQHFRRLTVPIGPQGIPSAVGVEVFRDDPDFERWDPHAPDEVTPVPARPLQLSDLDDPPRSWRFHISIAEIREMLARCNT